MRRNDINSGLGLFAILLGKAYILRYHNNGISMSLTARVHVRYSYVLTTLIACDTNQPSACPFGI